MPRAEPLPVSQEEVHRALISRSIRQPQHLLYKPSIMRRELQHGHQRGERLRSTQRDAAGRVGRLEKIRQAACRVKEALLL